MGKRRFFQQITHPSCNQEFLNQEYDMIEYVLNNEHFLDFRDQLNNIKDIEKLYRKTIHLTAKPYQLSTFYNNLSIIESIKKILENDDTFAKYIDSKCDIVKLSHSIKQLQTFFETHLNFSLCDDLQEVQCETNFFKRGLFTSLDKYEKQYIESNQELDIIRKKLTDIGKTIKGVTTKKSIESDSVIVTHKTEKSGVFLKITSARSNKMKTHFKNLKVPPINLNWKSNFGVSKYI